jgi:superfamily I DNA/RNA helicase
MRLKVPCAVKGKSIGDDIVNLVVKLDPLDIKDLHSRLGRWNEREQKKLLDRDAHETAFDALKDKVECITELSQECETIEQMISLCRDLFTESEDVNKVNLSSIHRAKGLEADNVTLLRPDLMCTRAKDEEAFQQEKNLLYVALTRAKSHLVFADGSGAGRPELNQWIGDIASRQMPKPRFSHR